MTPAGIASLKEGKKSVISTEEMMRAVERINEMVKGNKWKLYRESDNAKIRKEIMENPEDDPPIIMMATVAVALYTSLEKDETANEIR